MNIEDVAAFEVKGFLDHEEGLKLHEIAREAGVRGPCLEIGSYCGKSACYLGLGCKEAGGVLFSIDHHRGSEEQQRGQEYFDPELYDEAMGRVDTFRLFRGTMERAGLEDTVVPIVAPSEVAARMWSTPLSLIFIDGSHSYPSVFVDYTSWVPHLMPGGYLLIHDIFPDLKDGGQAPYYVYQLAVKSGLFEELPRLKTLGVLRRYGVGTVPLHVRGLRDY